MSRCLLAARGTRVFATLRNQSMALEQPAVALQLHTRSQWRQRKQATAPTSQLNVAIYVPSIALIRCRRMIVGCVTAFRRNHESLSANFQWVGCLRHDRVNQIVWRGMARFQVVQARNIFARKVAHARKT